MGADNICIKDMANLLLPYDAYQPGQEAQGERQEYPSTCIPTTPPAPATWRNLKAIEAGVDIVDYRALPAGQRHLPARYRVAGGDAAGHRVRYRHWI